MSAGIRPGGLNSICGTDVWKTIGLAKMLYGSQLWWNITKTDLEMLEMTNRFAAKRSQGLCSTTRSEAATGNLGLWTIEGYIDKSKLLFLQKLVVSSPDSIHKKIFIQRLFRFLNKVSSDMQGYNVHIFQVFQKYHLEDYLTIYVESGHFPVEQCWKNIVRTAIHSHQCELWRRGIDLKPELENYSFIHNELKPLELWCVALRNPTFLKAIANAVNIVSGNVPSAVMMKVSRGETDFTCNFCNKHFVDIPYHFVMHCAATMAEREKLWDLLQYRLPTSICGQLFNADDKTIYHNFFSGKFMNRCDQKSTDITDTLLLTVSQSLLQIFNKVAIQ